MAEDTHAPRLAMMLKTFNHIFLEANFLCRASVSHFYLRCKE